MDRSPQEASPTMMDRRAYLRYPGNLLLVAVFLASGFWPAARSPGKTASDDGHTPLPAVGTRPACLRPCDDRSVVLTSGAIKLPPVQGSNVPGARQAVAGDSPCEGPLLFIGQGEPRTGAWSSPPVGRESRPASPGGLTGAEEPVPPRLLGTPRQASFVKPPAVAAAQSPSLLPPPAAAAARPEGLERVAREADDHTRRAFELGGRSAYFSARAEFIAALRVLAQGLDNEYRTDVHSRALADALTAMKEADDFIPRGSQVEADLDVECIAGGHRTPVLKNAEAAKLTPAAAVQRYLTYAQEQLALAAGGEVAASMALRGLGKLHEAMAERNVQGIAAAQPKAAAFYQAALLAVPQNFMAWNDLGVLLARNGHTEEARMALERSVSFSPQPAAWQNLAAVYQRLGYGPSAERAYRQAQVIQQASRGAAGPAASLPVEWLDPKMFAQSGGDTPPGSVPAPLTLPPVKQVSQSPSGNSPGKRK